MKVPIECRHSFNFELPYLFSAEDTSFDKIQQEKFEKISDALSIFLDSDCLPHSSEHYTMEKNG